MNRALIPILGVTFVDVLGFTILLPLLPFYAEHYGAPPIVVGSIVTVVALVGLFAAPLWGRLSDRIGRKRVLVYSQLISALGYVLLGIGGSLAMIFAARAVEGVGGANLGVTQSYVSDVTEPKDRARAFGLLGAAFGSGFLLGPVIGAYLVGFGFAVPFFVAAAVQLVVVLMTARLLPESHKPLEKPVPPREILRALEAPGLRYLLLEQLFFGLSFTLWVTVFALFVERVLHYQASQTGLLYAAAAVVTILVQTLVVGRAVDRIGERNVAFIGIAFGIAAMATVGFVTDLPLFVLVIVLWAVSGALARPTIGAMISQAAPAERRGSILGASDALNSLAFIIGPLVSTSTLAANVHLVGILPVLCGLTAIAVGMLAPRVPGEVEAAA